MMSSEPECDVSSLSTYWWGRNLFIRIQEVTEQVANCTYIYYINTAKGHFKQHLNAILTDKRGAAAAQQARRLIKR